MLGGNVVVVGETRVGKSNLLYALRLIFDPTLPDSARQIGVNEFQMRWRSRTRCRRFTSSPVDQTEIVARMGGTSWRRVTVTWVTVTCTQTPFEERL